MHEDEDIAQIKMRVAQCRRLAAMMTDANVIAALTEMVVEGEASIKRLESQGRQEQREEYPQPRWQQG